MSQKISDRNAPCYGLWRFLRNKTAKRTATPISAIATSPNELPDEMTISISLASKPMNTSSQKRAGREARSVYQRWLFG